MWRLIYEIATGKLISIASVWSDPLPDGLDYIELVGEPDMVAQMWDQAGRSLIARPPKVRLDRLDDIKTDLTFADFRREIYDSLSVDQEAEFEKMLDELLGAARYRNQTEAVKIDDSPVIVPGE